MAAVDNIPCCLVTKTNEILELSRKGCLTACKTNETAIFAFQVREFLSYQQLGRELTPGFVSSAVLDLSDFAGSLPAVLYGNIFVNGVLIAVLPQDSYADIDALIAALVVAINTASTVYNATDLGSGAIMVETTDPGSEANGFIVSVVINPTIIGTNSLEPLWNINKAIYIDDPTSQFYGCVAYACNIGTTPLLLAAVRFFKNGVEIPQSPVYFPNNGTLIPGTITSYVLCHDEQNDRIYITGYALRTKFSWIDNSFNVGLTTPPYSAANPAPGVGSLSPGTGTAPVDIIYNPIDGCKYISAQGLVPGNTVTIYKLTASDVVSTVANAFVATGEVHMAVNPVNGDMWLCGATNIYVFDITGATIATMAAGGKPQGITYDPVGLRMYVSVYVAGSGNSFVMKLNMNGTIDDATFYTGTTTTLDNCNVFYSSVFNMLFINTDVGAGLTADIVDMSGNLNVNLPYSDKPVSLFYTEDTGNNTVIATSYFPGVGDLQESIITYFTPTDEGDETFDGAMEGGTAPTYSTGEENCIDPTQYNDLTQKLVAECGCCESDTTAETPVPSSGQFVIYYGSDIAEGANAATIMAMNSVTQSGYAGDYLFEFLDPSEFRYVAIPSSLGTPGSFTDPDTGFPVAMATSYAVTINFITYNVYQTFYALGGAITVRLAT